MTCKCGTTPICRLVHDCEPQAKTAGSPFAEQFAEELAELDRKQASAALVSPLELCFALSQAMLGHFLRQCEGWGRVALTNQQRAFQVFTFGGRQFIFPPLNDPNRLHE